MQLFRRFKPQAGNRGARTSVEEAIRPAHEPLRHSDDCGSCSKDGSTFAMAGGDSAPVFQCSGCHSTRPLREYYVMPRCDCPLCQQCVRERVQTFLERELSDWEPRIQEWKNNTSLPLRVPSGRLRARPGDPIPCPTNSCMGIIPLGDCQLLVPDLSARWCEVANVVFFAQSSFVRCPHPTCHMVIERVADTTAPGGSDAREVDGAGRALSDAALNDRSKNRYRCPMCGINFCANCKSVPYHLGETCAEWNAPRCLYCEDRLPVGWRQTTEKTWKGKSTKVMKKQAEARKVDAGWCGGDAKAYAEVFRLCATVCDKSDCLSRLQASCTKKLPCGHRCGGVRGHCLPCLQDGCAGSERGSLPSGDDFCPICMVESLDKAPSILLACGHVVHKHCAEGKVLAGYPGPAISFKYLECPLCSKELEHPTLKSIMEKPLEHKAMVKAKAMVRLDMEQRVKPITELLPGGTYEGRREEYALHMFQFFMCATCQKFYFGGLRQCGVGEANANGDGADDAARGYDPEDLICGSCTAMASGAEECTRGHGSEYIQFKCRYCCSIATFFCWGTTHFCDDCHVQRPDREKSKKKPFTCTGPSACPLGVPHPPAGSECYLGCALCRYGEP